MNNRQLMNYGLIQGILLVRKYQNNKRVTRQQKNKLLPEIILWMCQINRKRLLNFTQKKNKNNRWLRSWLLKKRGVMCHVLKPPINQRGQHYNNNNNNSEYGFIIGTFLIIHCLNNIIGWIDRLTRSQIRRMTFLSANVIPKLISLCNKKSIYELTNNEKKFRQQININIS